MKTELKFVFVFSAVTVGAILALAAPSPEAVVIRTLAIDTNGTVNAHGSTMTGGVDVVLANGSSLSNAAAQAASAVHPATLAGYATDAELDSTQSRAELAASRNRIILLGDSLTAQNSTWTEYVTAAKRGAEGIGYFNWARGYLARPMTLVTNLGAGGTTSAAIYTQAVAAAAFDADIAIVCAGRNDVSQSVPVATCTNNLANIITTLQGQGKRVVMLNVTPSGLLESTNTMIQARGQINNWIKNAPYYYPGLVTVDAEGALMDYSTSGLVSTNMAYDAGTHWSQHAAALIGKRTADALATIVPSAAYNWYPLGSPLNVCGNPTFTSGTGWTDSGTNVTTTFVASTEHFGSYVATLTVADETAATVSVVYIENISSGRFAAGDVIRLRADIEWDVTDWQAGDKAFRPFVWIRPRNVDNSYDTDWFAFFSASSGNEALDYAPKTGRGVWSTPAYTVGANVDRLYMYVGFEGGISNGVVKVHKFSAYKEIP